MTIKGLEATMLAPGMRLVVSSGDYSDYMIHCVLAVLLPFTPMEALHEYGRTNAIHYRDTPGGGESFHKDKFILWLESQGYVKEMNPDWLEWKLESYGRPATEMELSRWLTK